MGILGNIFGKKNEPKVNEDRPTLKDDLLTGKDWIASALLYSGYNADFSLESLREVDRFFDEQNVAGGLLSEDRGMRLFALGAYVGEVVISLVGGEWITDDNDPQGEMNVSIKLPDGSIIWPVQRLMKRYQNGAQDSIYDYVFTLVDHPS